MSALKNITITIIHVFIKNGFKNIFFSQTDAADDGFETNVYHVKWIR